MQALLLFIVLFFPLNLFSSLNIETILQKGVLASSLVGVCVGDAESGEILYEHNGDKMFTPASSTKVITTAAALHYLTPEYKTKTSVYYDGILENGVLQGNLILYGRGDGTLSESSFQNLARECKQAGINQVRGSIIIDTSYFDCPLLCNQWEIGDVFDNSFAVETTSLSCNQNRFGKDNHQVLKTLKELFKNALEKAGITIHEETSGVPLGNRNEIAFIDSPALADMVKGTNKVSNNFFAELLVNTMGVHYSKVSGNTFERGRAAITEFLRGIDSSIALYLGDGSGLSRYTLVSPRTFVKVLSFVAKQPYSQVFFDSLPIAGIDGTLATRFIQGRGYNNVHAKTGTLSHVSSLSGYATTLSGRKLVFSIIVNNCLGIDAANMETAKACRDAIDEIVVSSIETL